MPWAGGRNVALTPPGMLQHLSPRWLLRALLARRGSIIANLGRDSRHDLGVVRETRMLVPLLMGDAAALHIQACVRAARQLDGDMAEAGVLMGGSARLICETKGDTLLHLFDVFETLQLPVRTPRTPAESEIRAHFGDVHGCRAQVERLLAPYGGVCLHQGIFPETTIGLEDARFSFVHIDMDLPQSVWEALIFFHPRMIAGGIMIGDDYNDPGVRGTFAEFFAGSQDTLIGLPWGQVMVVRQGAEPGPIISPPP